MKFIILISILYYVSADIAEETIQRLKNYPPTAACDNFYRHACPVNSTNLMENYKNEARLIAKSIIDSPFAQYEIMTDFLPLDNIFDLEELHSVFPFVPVILRSNFTLEGLTSLYYDQCMANKDTTKLMEYFEKYLTTTAVYYYEKCYGATFCASHLAKEPNCERGRQQLEKEMVKNLMNTSRDGFWNYRIAEIQKALQLNFLKVVGAHMIETNPKINNGSKVLQNMFVEMKKLFSDWIKSTKWVRKNDAVPYMLSIVDKLVLLHDFTDPRDYFATSLKNAEYYYQKCKQEVKIDLPHAKALCLLCASAKERIHLYDSFNAITGYANAFNAHPSINFALPFYLAADDIKTEAGQIGFLGSVLAHEISHSLIEDNSQNQQHYIPFFSKVATDCIQKTYQNTCDEFKETSCAVDPKQVDENGSDILSAQIAYAHFRNAVGEDYNKIYDPLNITHEQLYFYSISAFFCQGELSEQPSHPLTKIIDTHSADNIRVNVFAQHPEFRNAFNCADDSRMVKVNPEQCQIYGPNAPEVKRHRLGWF